LTFQFLAEDTQRKLIVNLGCGFDPLPFVYLSSGANACFVDVDFPELIQRKCQIVRDTPALTQVAGADCDKAFGEIRGKSYCAVGCDLSDLNKFESILREIEPNLNDTPILFLSEVAITYMVSH
jgi:tRNA wybutosine-synthesizing protein 4